jgi:hypothetical protein
MLSLRGQDGRTPVKGVDYTDGRTPVKGVDYTDGRTPVKGVDYTDGRTPVKGVDYTDGKDGAAGNRNRWESRAPGATDAGAVGDAWYHAISADKLAIYECFQTVATAAGASQWRVRYTTPDAQTPTPGTGTGNANYPTQSPSTAGKYLKSSGAAGGESWDTPNRCTIELKFLQLLEETVKLFFATSWLRFEKDDNVASLTYSINGAASVVVPFPAGSNVYTPASPISAPAGALVTWKITYNSSGNVAFAHVYAAATLPTI